MILLSQLVERYQGDLERLHGAELLPSHRAALQAMARCRKAGSDAILLTCPNCKGSLQIPHSCGHRSCPHCQHHESQQWLERQRAKLLPVRYFLLTFTVPAELRNLFWLKQKTAYDLLLKIAWQTVASFARRDPRLKGRTGAHAVLHTHNRKLGYHPHVHLIVPAGALNESSHQWRRKRGTYLFKEENLAKVFRAKWFEALRRLGWTVKTTLPSQWVVDCKAVGTGEAALVYLGRYLYRGVLPEKNILSDHKGQVTFRSKDNQGHTILLRVPGGEFLWLLLRHVLPKRFRRVRDFGLLQANAKPLIQRLQLLLNVAPAPPAPPIPKPPVLCPTCGHAMAIKAIRVKGSTHLLC
ncbi:MAG: transposase [Cyanobacteriota bacterium]